MISFELAEKLKNAGYPQKGNVWNTEMVFPTLLELIEACGNRFENLYFYSSTKKWATNVEICCLECIPEGWDKEETLGETPEEAVANLWFKFHETS